MQANLARFSAIVNPARPPILRRSSPPSCRNGRTSSRSPTPRRKLPHHDGPSFVEATHASPCNPQHRKRKEGEACLAPAKRGAPNVNLNAVNEEQRATHLYWMQICDTGALRTCYGLGRKLRRRVRRARLFRLGSQRACSPDELLRNPGIPVRIAKGNPGYGVWGRTIASPPQQKKWARQCGAHQKMLWIFSVPQLAPTKMEALGGGDAAARALAYHRSVCGVCILQHRRELRACPELSGPAGKDDLRFGAWERRDSALRIIGDRLGHIWGQQVVIVNQPGAGGHGSELRLTA